MGHGKIESRALAVNPKDIHRAMARDKALFPDCRPDHYTNRGHPVWIGDKQSIGRAVERYAHKQGFEVP
jgi:hypothetical protein